MPHYEIFRRFGGTSTGLFEAASATDAVNAYSVQLGFRHARHRQAVEGDGEDLYIVERNEDGSPLLTPVRISARRITSLIPDIQSSVAAIASSLAISESGHLRAATGKSDHPAFDSFDDGLTQEMRRRGYATACQEAFVSLIKYGILSNATEVPDDDGIVVLMDLEGEDPSQAAGLDYLTVLMRRRIRQHSEKHDMARFWHVGILSSLKMLNGYGKPAAQSDHFWVGFLGHEALAPVFGLKDDTPAATPSSPRP